MAAPPTDLASDHLKVADIRRVYAHINIDDDHHQLEQLMGAPAETAALPALAGPARTAAQLLPRYIILKSYSFQHYLRQTECTYGSDEKPTPVLQYSGPLDEMNPDIKFEVEVAKSDPEYVHIRSCYNNKYWEITDQKGYITATAVKTEEKKIGSTTLFKPIVVDHKEKTYRLVDFFTGNYTRMWSSTRAQTLCLNSFGKEIDKSEERFDVHYIIDWESIVILPKFVAFKGDNGLYLKVQKKEEEKFLAFNATDFSQEYVVNEIVPISNGNVRIKNDDLKTFWRHDPDDGESWILVESSESDRKDEDTWFKPIRMGKNIIALHNIGKAMYCKRHPEDSPWNNGFLSARSLNIDKLSRLIVEVPTLARKISAVVYHVKDASTYGHRSVNFVKQEVFNRTGLDHELELSIKFTDAVVRSWNTSSSVTTGVVVTVSAEVPLIKSVSGELKFEAEKSITGGWGKSDEDKIEFEGKWKGPALKNSRTVLTLKATTSFCNIPFSYTQRELLTNGRDNFRTMHDGMFKGVNSHTVYVDAKSYPITG